MQHSEYQKKFRPIGPSVVESHYAQLLAYRRARRSTEASHHRWTWGADSSSEEELKEEEEPLTDLEEESEEERVEKAPRNAKSNGLRVNGAVSDPEDEGEVEERLKRLALQKVLEKERSDGRPRKPRNPKNRLPIPRPQKSKEPPQKSANVLENKNALSQELPMFVLYGRGDHHGRATFNVRSDRDVHPSALRANRRRLAEIERRQRAKLVAPAREKRANYDPSVDLAKLKMQRETAAWQSEYRKNYPTYELACYRRSLANLTPRPVSAML